MVIIATPSPTESAAPAAARELHLTLRTYQREPKPGIKCVESGFHYAAWPVSVRTDQAALVLVDVWNTHVIASHAARTAEIARTCIAPALAAARRAGVAVVHAPSPVQARRYPQWTRYSSEADARASALHREPSLPEGDWPPVAFRRREGPFAQFRRPQPPPATDLLSERNDRLIDPSVAPEPEDFVVATGDQLHRLCRARGILHLFYAGFAANICIPFKEYGMRAFHARGYHTILLRDATTAIEGHDTVDSLAGTRQAIRELEMAGIAATTTCEAFVTACTT